ncbi:MULTISPECIES: helix-turn-helix domain-containing protein [unclassified Dysgonomonas]|uniref:helix-turn-helix domain-containing protein n=1 Tax=unclassified Dysgonomonas TaxID=2630389 RepID=UPI0013EE081E|nr:MULTISPECIES: helix-turn-helix transcriptional regulator [unclassified Dysgonomonas]
MNTDKTFTPRAHHGHTVRKLRELLGIQPEKIAKELDIPASAVLELEQKEVLENEILNKISKVLGIPVESIKNYEAEYAVNIISNTFQDEAAGYVTHYKCTFNPIDKVVELYERALKEKDERIAALEKELKYIVQQNKAENKK